MSKTPERVLIVGATSDMGRALAHCLASRGHALMIAGRDLDKLNKDATDLQLRYQIRATAHRLDMLKTESHAAFLDALPVVPDWAICLVGLMGVQHESEKAPDLAATVMRTNYEAPALLLGEIANRFQQRGKGTIVGVSSVAGDRGRASNYVYGSAKAGFTAFLSGLRGRLVNDGVRVVTVKPGFIRTRMTESMDLPQLLTLTSEEFAEQLVGALSRRGNVVYIPRRWMFVMLLIRAMPERLFSRLRI